METMFRRFNLQECMGMNGNDRVSMELWESHENGNRNTGLPVYGNWNGNRDMGMEI